MCAHDTQAHNNSVLNVDLAVAGCLLLSSTCTELMGNSLYYQIWQFPAR